VSRITVRTTPITTSAKVKKPPSTQTAPFTKDMLFSISTSLSANSLPRGVSGAGHAGFFLGASHGQVSEAQAGGEAGMIGDTPNQIPETAPEVRSDQNPPHHMLRHGNRIQLAIVLVLLFTLAVSAWSAWSSQRNARLLAADATWERYMELAFQYPNLESGQIDFRDGNSPNDVQYAWFVERGIFAGDQIMAIQPDDPQWQDAIAFEVERHKRYILSNTFLAESPATMSSFCTYRRPLRSLIIRTFRSDAAATRRLRVAEDRCRAVLSQRGWPNG
jgi:hypothetical protein